MLSNKTKIIITLGVDWGSTVVPKQTLFPVWGDNVDRRPRKGSPPHELLNVSDTTEFPFSLRATKGVNMYEQAGFCVLQCGVCDNSFPYEVRCSCPARMCISSLTGLVCTFDVVASQAPVPSSTH
jgi:hypothetical protein